MANKLSPGERMIHDQALNFARACVVERIWRIEKEKEIDEYNKNKHWWQPRKASIYETPSLFGIMPPADLLDELCDELSEEERKLIGLYKDEEEKIMANTKVAPKNKYKEDA
jgi:hypothetical protein